MSYTKKITIFTISILLIDILWIKLYMSKMYTKLYNTLGITQHFKPLYAFFAYIIMISAFPLIIIDKNNLKMIKKAAIVGFIIYGTYGFTLAAILPNYNIELAIIEMLWGIFLYSITTLIVTILS